MYFEYFYFYSNTLQNCYVPLSTDDRYNSKRLLNLLLGGQRTSKVDQCEKVVKQRELEKF